MSIALVGGLLEAFDALPETDQAECRDAIAAGDYIDASFLCPAGAFLGAIFHGGPSDDEDEDEESDT
jgi:hypothetical protein